MSQYHPYQAGEGGFLDQVFERLPAEQVIYPKQELRALGHEAFYKTDTHWTHKGALLAAVVLARRLGAEESALKKWEKTFNFKVKNHVGDLGNKLTPPVAADAPVLASGSYRRFLVYDNGLPNFGRILVFQNKNPLIQGQCLVFGSSSSYSMFQMLQRLFSEVVFVHTAGNLDEAVIAAVNPDYLIAQTNARFMVRAPINKSNVLTVIEEKLAALSEEEQERTRKNYLFKPEAQALLSGLQAWHQPVADFLEQGV